MSKQNFIKPDHLKEYSNRMSKLYEDPLLEKEVVDRLKEEKLITDHSFLIHHKWLVAVCTSFICFSAGYITADILKKEYFEPNYMIFLLEDEAFNPPADLNLVHSYGLWMNSVLEEGVKIQGNELANLPD